jgi:peptide/nickel transport system permease protein
MLGYIVRRLVYMVITLVAISIVSFVVIQLPPGDFLTTYVTSAAREGRTINPSELAALEARYGLDQPVAVQYLDWVAGMAQGDFGYSFKYGRPVGDLIWDRIGLSFLLSVLTLVFVWLIAFPLGVISAARQYSWGDYISAIFGMVGLATPDFLFALVLLWLSFDLFGQSVGGLFSPQFVDAPWSLARFGDFLAHLWVPLVVLGTNGVAGLSRVLRANLLDELNKPYVTAARARGLRERTLLLKYPVRIAMNPFVSTSGGLLPALVSGEAIVAIVLSLPTTGPLLLEALQSQDMYLAGSMVLLLSTLGVIGTLLSDLALAWFDPRIRYA